MSKNRRKKRASKKALPKKRVPSTGMCFTIMPFGGYFDQYYESIYKPAITKAGLRPERADNLYRPSAIVSDIVRFTREADIVLADLSGRNPNVFYELGLAHETRTPVILVVDNMDDVPFDLRALRVLEYDKNAPGWDRTLLDEIVKSIGEVLKNPALSLPDAFIDTRPAPDDPQLTEQNKEFLTMRRDIDLLRREVLALRKAGQPQHLTTFPSIGIGLPPGIPATRVFMNGHGNWEVDDGSATVSGLTEDEIPGGRSARLQNSPSDSAGGPEDSSG